MTSEELIPILKALHADPTCAPQLADWFEDRDDVETADILRWGKFLHGKHIVRTLTCGGVVWCRDDSPYGHLDARRNVAFQSAVIDEAWSRVAIDETERIRLFDYTIWHRKFRQVMIRVSREEVQFIPHCEHWPMEKITRYTCVSDDGERTARSYLTPAWIDWEPDVTVFYGDDWLRCQMCVWVGRDPLNHRTIMTHPCKSLCRDIRIVEMPF